MSEITAAPPQPQWVRMREYHDGESIGLVLEQSLFPTVKEYVESGREDQLVQEFYRCMEVFLRKDVPLLREVKGIEPAHQGGRFLCTVTARFGFEDAFDEQPHPTMVVGLSDCSVPDDEWQEGTYVFKTQLLPGDYEDAVKLAGTKLHAWQESLLKGGVFW